MSWVSALGTLFIGVAALVSSGVSAWAVLRGTKRGSDGENRRAAQFVASQVVENAASPEGDSNVFPIEQRERGGADDGR